MPLTLYVLTACRDIYWVDSTEFALCGRLFCLPHPPGYPLLTMILRVVSLVPALAAPFRMNLVSSFAAAGSCLFVFLVVRRLTRDAPAGLFAALVWAVSYELWSQATALEAYTLNALLVSAALYAVVVWTQEGRVESLFLTAFAFGLGLANHLTIALWLPGLVILAWTRPLNRLSLRIVLALLGFIAAGPLLYLVLPRLSSAVGLAGWDGVTDARTLIEFASGRMYRYRLASGEESYIGSQLAALPALMGKQFLVSWFLLIPGIGWCRKHHRRLGLATLFSFLLVTGFAIFYNIPDKEGFFLPAYFAAVLIIGAGFARVRVSGRFRPFSTLVGLVLFALPLILFYQRQDRHRLCGLRDLSESLIVELPEGAVLFTDDYSTVQGLRWVAQERDRDPVLTVNEYLLVFPWYLSALSRHISVPEPAFVLARRLWQKPAHGAEFGEQARATIQQVKRLLAQTWIQEKTIFWMPRDFQVWAESWHEFRLGLRGLTYRLATSQDSIQDSTVFTFPGPDRYRIVRFYDAETQDLCRRFAATANRRGIIRFSRGDNPGALADFNLALEYFPEYPSPIENKGIVFFYANEPDSARHYLNAYLERATDNQEIMKVRAFLNQLNGQDSSPKGLFNEQ